MNGYCCTKSTAILALATIKTERELQRGKNTRSQMNNPLVEKSPLILVVDDDRLMRKLLRQAMEQEGYQVIEARNGEECLEVYQRQNPDIVLLNIVMPVMDGITCCRELQSLSQKSITEENDRYSESTLLDRTEKILAALERTPILMITGLDDANSIDRAFQVGAVDYITKPINWAVLRQRVRSLIERANLYQQLQVASRNLQRLALIDELTQLSNRRHFDEYLQRQWGIMVRGKRPLSLIMCDLDFFKLYNDRYGHQAGDSCLRTVAAAIASQAKRPGDLVARYGGEEIVILLPDTSSYGAASLAQTIRETVKALNIEHLASPISARLTLSLGVACLIPKIDGSPAKLIEAADLALYEAKKTGRDRAIVHR